MLVLLYYLSFFRFEGGIYLKKATDYLLKYITNDTYQKVLTKNHQYTIENLADNRVDVDLNIRHLIKLGVKNIDAIALERLDYLLMNHNDFIQKMNDYEAKLTKDGLISMLDNS